MRRRWSGVRIVTAEILDAAPRAGAAAPVAAYVNRRAVAATSIHAGNGRDAA